jgi:signal transduction histidine kinase
MRLNGPIQTSFVFAPATAALLFFSLAALRAAEPAGGTTIGPATVTTLDPSYRVGSWIWTKNTFDKQTCRFWKSFEIAPHAMVAEARLRITADNSYTVFLDGRELGHGSVWTALTEHNLTWLLPPGMHVLAVEAYNDFGEAGLLAGLYIELKDERVIEIPSDTTWRIVPNDEKHWTTRKSASLHWDSAVVIAAFKGGTWTTRPARIFHESPVKPDAVAFWRSGWFQITLLCVCGIVILICLRLLGQLALQSKAHQILQRERARIARDIHDELGAGLHQLVLFGEVAQSELPQGSETRVKFDRLCDKGRTLLTALDEVVWTVNSRRDTFGDFEAYVCTYAEKFLQPASIRCRLEADAEIPDTQFDLASRRSLFMAIKEALNNVVRHSGATEVVLSIHLAVNRVVVIVEDNGHGFDLATASPGRNGLLNMQQRANEAGGSCVVTSRPGGGCRVEFSSALVDSPHTPLRWWPRRASAAEAGEPGKPAASPAADAAHP